MVATAAVLLICGWIASGVSLSAYATVIHRPIRTQNPVRRIRFRERISTSVGSSVAPVIVPNEQIQLRRLFGDGEEIYSQWGNWSRCSRRCKQVRSRRCISSSHCGTTVQKEERGCRGHRCYRTPFTVVPGRRGRRGRASSRDLLHLHRLVYSNWSEWSECSSACHTVRYKLCVFQLYCNDHVLLQEAFCYEKGSACEKLYKKRRNKNKEPDADFQLTVPADSPAEEDVECGIPGVPGTERALRIIGGQTAMRGRWPWQAAILNRHKEVFCGGTLINSQWVLTAAHCVRKRLYVRVGEHDLSVKEGSEQEFKVDDVFIHPEYDLDTVDNDVALLKISGRIEMGNYVRPICLPRHSAPLPVDQMCVIIGWGKQKHTAPFGTDILQEAKVPIVNSQTCLQGYMDYYISDNMFCSGYKRGRVDSCMGDSGGPLLCEMDGRWQIFGITSFGEGCGRKGKYGIYAKVPNYVRWIQKITKEKGD